MLYNGKSFKDLSKGEASKHMKKKKLTILLLGFLLSLSACGNGVDEGQILLGEPTTSNGRDCMIITGEESMQEFFDQNHHELMNIQLGDLDAFLNPYIDHYTGIYFDGSGYIILFAEELTNWQTPEILTDVNFTVCRAENSYNEMAEIREYLWENFDDTMANVTGWGIDTIDNILVVYLYEFTDEEVEFFRENIIDSPLIEFRQGAWDVVEDGSEGTDELGDSTERNWIIEMTIYPTGHSGDDYLIQIDDNNMIRAQFGIRNEYIVSRIDDDFFSEILNEAESVVSQEELDELLYLAQNLDATDGIMELGYVEGGWEVVLQYNGVLYGMDYSTSDFEPLRRLAEEIIRLSPIEVELHSWS